MLAIIPLFAVALGMTAVLGVTLLFAGKRDRPGEVVDMMFLPEDSSWVVKVYADVSNMFEVQVLHSREFITSKRGFVSIEKARGWGLNYARERV